MGKNALRKVLKSEQKWRDKNCVKHKHVFNIHAVVELQHGDTGNYTYHDVMKCNKCNSFNTVARQGAIDGYITDTSIIDRNTPIIRMYTPHRWIIGWTDAIIRTI